MARLAHALFVWCDSCGRRGTSFAGSLWLARVLPTQGTVLHVRSIAMGASSAIGSAELGGSRLVGWIITHFLSEIFVCWCRCHAAG